MAFKPSSDIINRYARLLIHFCLNYGQGIKPKQVVELVVPDVAKPLALALQNTVLKAGSYPIIKLLPTGFDKDYYTLAQNHQLKFFPQKYLKSRVNLIDHRVFILAETHPQELKNINPQKIFLKRNTQKPYFDWLEQKETQKKLSHTIALWGTQAKAKIAGLSLQNYWQQIIKACYLDLVNPLKKWQQILEFQNKTIQKLNQLQIQSVHLKGPDLNLKLGIGSDRVWQGGKGINLPSFEIFTAPHFNQAEGWIRFNQPVYRYGNLIDGIYLEFKAGRVIKAQAKKGQNFLTQMLQTKNADRLGEFSLTDKRLSRINHFMAEILFDENLGGPYGNTHIALGKAYKDCFKGDPLKLTPKDWHQKGFNDSAEHTDFISTTDRIVTAALKGGQTKTIYQNGQFTL